MGGLKICEIHKGWTTISRWEEDKGEGGERERETRKEKRRENAKSGIKESKEFRNSIGCSYII